MRVALHVGWIAVALMVAGRARGDRPLRIDHLNEHTRAHSATDVGTRALERVGSLVLRAAAPGVHRVVPWRLRSRADVLVRAPSRTIGIITLVALGALLLTARTGPVLPVVLIAGTSLSARMRRRRMARRQRDRVAAAIPDLIDLLRLAIDSGCTVATGLRAVAREYHGVLAGELTMLDRDLADGHGVSAALEQFVGRLGEPVRPLCTALLSTERYGLPLGTVLDSLAHEARVARRRSTEIRARRLTITMLFPLITCILPAFAMLTVVPLMVSGLRSVHW